MLAGSLCARRATQTAPLQRARNALTSMMCRGLCMHLSAFYFYLYHYHHNAFFFFPEVGHYYIVHNLAVMKFVNNTDLVVHEIGAFLAIELVYSRPNSRLDREKFLQVRSKLTAMIVRSCSPCPCAPPAPSTHNQTITHSIWTSWRVKSPFVNYQKM